MDPERKAVIQRRIIALLIMVFVALFVYTRKQNSAKERLSVKTSQVMTIDMKQAKKSLSDFGTKKSEYRGKALKDPLKKHAEIAMLERGGAFPVGAAPRAEEKELPKENFVLEGVIWGGDKNLAIISGSVVSEGEMIGSAKVMRISEDEVILMKNGREIELKR